MQTTTLKIQGMTCMGCVNSVKTILEKMPGVAQAHVSLEQAQVTINYHTEQASEDQFKFAIEEAGFEVVA